MSIIFFNRETKGLENPVGQLNFVKNEFHPEPSGKRLYVELSSINSNAYGYLHKAKTSN